MANETKQPTVVGGINLSTRTKSKTFWVAIISAVAVFANQITGAFGLDYSAQIEQGVNIVGSILTLLAGLGIIVDNNTKGLKDSDIVQTDYTKPRDSKDPNEFVQWQANANTASTFELDNYENNAEPDTDDSDEVPAIEDEIDGGSAPSQDEEDTEEHGKVFAEEEVK
ncbi:holin [Staphylococcus phage PG-2021_87]